MGCPILRWLLEDLAAYTSLNMFSCTLFSRKRSFSCSCLWTGVVPTSGDPVTWACSQRQVLVFLADWLCPAVWLVGSQDSWPALSHANLHGMLPSCRWQSGGGWPCSCCLRLYCPGLTVIMRSNRRGAMLAWLCSCKQCLLCEFSPSPLLSWSPVPSTPPPPLSWHILTLAKQLHS